MTEKSYSEAMRETYREALAELDDVFVMGEDVEQSLLGTTDDLVDDFGDERVRDTPISEAGFTGVGVGAAMQGKRPIVEYQINTAVYVAADQIINQAQKLSHMSNGQVSVPLTITVPMSGAPGGLAGQHSDNPWPVFLQYGVKTAIPTTPYDAKGLLRSAIEEDDPVMVFFPVVQQTKRAEVPDESYTVPLGDAAIRREGSDVTVVAIGEAVDNALSVADAMDDVDVEVVDPRTLVPLDEETILDSVEKTGRVVVAENANRLCGMAGDIAARISNLGFWDLDAPIKRVTRPHAAPPPFCRSQERELLVYDDVVEEAIRDVTW